jgi:hypothetical protein
MKNKWLAKRLEKNRDPSLPISFRLTRPEAIKLSEIESIAGLKYDSILKALVRALIRNWEQTESIELPIHVAVLSLKEARRLKLPGSEKPSDEN